MPGEVYAVEQLVRLPRKRPGLRRSTMVPRHGGQKCPVRRSCPFAQLHAAGQAVLVQPGGSVTRPCFGLLAGEPSHTFTKQADTWRARLSLTSKSGTWVPAGRGRAGVTVPPELLYARAHITAGSRDPWLLTELVTCRWLAVADPDICNLARVTSALCVQSRWSAWAGPVLPSIFHSAAVAAVNPRHRPREWRPGRRVPR